MSHASSHELDIGAVAQLACLLEVSAPKPGNIAPGTSFGDTTYEDFLASAAAIGRSLGSAGARPVGQTIRLAIEATRRWTRANTNLGIVLLLAPLARAAALAVRDGSNIGPEALRASLQRVLGETTLDDARDAYAAIRLASPGGLGSAREQDVSTEPSVTLTEAMRLAAHRDGIANEYATTFHATFEIAAPALGAALAAGLDWNDAILETFLTLLANAPDTHIARRAGTTIAADVTRRSRDVLDEGGVRSAAGRAAVAKFNDALRGHRNLANPGTTADITAAAIFVTLLAGTWRSTIGGVDATPR